MGVKSAMNHDKDVNESGDMQIIYIHCSQSYLFYPRKYVGCEFDNFKGRYSSAQAKLRDTPTARLLQIYYPLDIYTQYMIRDSYGCCQG